MRVILDARFGTEFSLRLYFRKYYFKISSLILEPCICPFKLLPKQGNAALGKIIHYFNGFTSN